MQSSSSGGDASSAAEGEDRGDGQWVSGWTGVSEAGSRKPCGWISAWHYLLLTGCLRVQGHVLSPSPKIIPKVRIETTQAEIGQARRRGPLGKSDMSVWASAPQNMHVILHKNLRGSSRFKDTLVSLSLNTGWYQKDLNHGSVPGQVTVHL